MHRITRRLLTSLLGASVMCVQPSSRLLASAAEGREDAQKASLKRTAAPAADIPFDDHEPQVEQQLLVLANQSRRQAGVPLLKLDAGLSQAARAHALAMLEAGQLSHQFTGEGTLPTRLATATALQLDQEGENVALDYGAEQGHQHLMLSPPHRANLLNPAYDVVGLGVVRNGDRLYIVEDFARALPSYSSTDVKDLVATAVLRARGRSRLSELALEDSPVADDAACSMAQADRLGTPQARKLAEHFTVMTYNTLHPETLPTGANHALTSRTLRRFSVGACYARTETYPTGVYWVVLTLN